MTENKFLKVDHENYDWSTETMSRVPADGTIWWYDDNGYIFSIIANGTDDVETLRADQIEAYTQAVTKAGCQCDIDGEGYVAGESTVIDHSGKQNPATATDVEPVDSKWGKMLHYNGVTSNLEFDNPVIGTTGTFRLIAKREDLVTANVAGNIRYTDFTGITFISYSTGVLRVQIGTGTTTLTYETEFSSISEYYVFHVILSDTQISLASNGEIVSTSTLGSTVEIGLLNFILGEASFSTGNFFNGDLSFNYTTEILTADEIKSDFNNPRKFSNEPVSQTPTAYTMSQHDENGHTLMEFATKTATSEGNQGAIAFDATNVYFCIADSSWKKITLETI